MHQLKDDRLIYLDVDFISRKYEEKFGITSDTKITKQEGGNANIKAFFATAGVTTQESRTYSITSRQMLHSLWGRIQDEYEEFQGFENYKGTKILWLSGSLTVAEWKMQNSDEPGYEFFQLNHGSERTAFVADESYFSAGFSKILGASVALKGNVSIPVRCLARVFWHVDAAQNYVACPYVICESDG
ncbi:hypothetical protein L3V59_36145 [Burkholderia aenigmatica]|uniref:hypothetical protein n=1 Tax=Burkholderia aenigmatica TaxID=2015348 RepID=UPI001F2D65AB|nr:hypothetical protein [Burkholderia aenigmatica]UKD17381.1 hypothetical protein L3V59_36145 [Burkholderia aenigmatica]